MKALIVGGAGYIGSVVTRLLRTEGHQVVVLDDCSTGHADSVPADVPFARGDISTSATVLAGGGFDAMTEHRVPTLVFSSTAAIYGEPDTVPITEDAPTRPTNTYGATKLAVDMMITGQCVATDLTAVSLRYFNVAGAALGAGERHDVETHLIPNALGAVAGTKNPLTVFGDDWPTPDGTPIRDYVHVLDLAHAHMLALTAATPGEHLICNLGNGDGYSVKQVLSTVDQVTGRPVPHTGGPRRAGDPTRLVASADRAKQRLGWTPELTLTDMIADAWVFQTAGRTIR